MKLTVVFILQIHIVKKSKKWICKMCNSKQSILKVYLGYLEKNYLMLTVINFIILIIEKFKF